MSFQYVQPSEDQIVLMKGFRDKFEALSEEIKLKVGVSRGVSLSITKLEESAFWLNKAITNNE